MNGSVQLPMNDKKQAQPEPAADAERKRQLRDKGKEYFEAALAKSSKPQQRGARENVVDPDVAEFGAHNLHGLTLRERAEALIDLAHPDFRAELRREIVALRHFDFGAS